MNPKRVDLTGPCDDTEEPEGQGDQENWDSNDSWEAWAKEAEEWLLTKYRTNKAPYRGRGQEDKLEKITISAPQHSKDGVGHNAQCRKLQGRMQQIKRLNYLTQRGRTEEEYWEQYNLEQQLGRITEGEME